MTETPTTIARFSVEHRDADAAYGTRFIRDRAGEWVRYTDLAALQAENERLNAENGRIIGKIKALKEAHDRDAVENEYFDVLAEAK